MKTYFKSINDKSALQQFLEKEIPINRTTRSDVEIFLNQQGFSYHHISELSKLTDSHLKHLISQKYDSVIQCRTRAPSETWFGLPAGIFFWEIRFHFLSDKLVDIIITYIEDNPL